MSDEQEPIAEVAAETPSEPTQEADQTENLEALAKAEREAPEPEKAEAEEPEAPEAEAAPEPIEEFEEIDWEGGKKYSIPKALKEAFMKNADYTRKTQEVATHRKELEQRAEALDQQAKATEEELHARAQLYNLEQQLTDYQNVNWDQLEQDDPIGAPQHWRRFQMLRDQWQATNHDLTNRQQERHAQTQRDIAKRHEDTEKFARSIPGWTPETGQKIADFAQAEGVPFDALQANITPQLYSILYKAMLGAESLKKPAAVKPVAPLKPLTTVAAKTPASTPSKNPPSSMEDYVSWRKKQGYGAR